MGKKRQKRSFKQWKKQDPTAKMPGIQVVPSSPNAKVARIIDRDQRHFAAKPGTDWLLRPCVPGEFDETASSIHASLILTQERQRTLTHLGN